MNTITVSSIPNDAAARTTGDERVLHDHQHTIIRDDNGNEIDEYDVTDNSFRTDMEEALREKYGPAPTCSKCIHMKTCVIFRNVEPMMQSMFGMLGEKDRPFKGEELAKICREYEHSIIEKPEEFKNKNA